MFILRATESLRRHLGALKGIDEHVQSETALGDWYATHIVVDRQPLLIAISSHGYLPLIAPARHLANLEERFPELVAQRLKRLCLPATAWFGETDSMHSVLIGPTVDRSINGVLTTIAREIRYHLPKGAWNDRSLARVEDVMFDTPWHASRRGDQVVRPSRVVREMIVKHWGDDVSEIHVPWDVTNFPPSDAAPDNFPSQLPFLAGLPGSFRLEDAGPSVSYTIANDPMDDLAEFSDADMHGRFADLRLRGDSITSPYGPLGKAWNRDSADAMVRAAVDQVMDDMIAWAESEGWKETRSAFTLDLAPGRRRVEYERDGAVLRMLSHTIGLGCATCAWVERA